MPGTSRAFISIVQVEINNVNIRIQAAYLGQEPVTVTDGNRFLQITISIEDWEYNSVCVQCNIWHLVQKVGDEK